MKSILKRKWFILIAWVAFIAVLFMAAPDMEKLVREKGQINVPDGYSSTLAEEILNDVQSSENSGNDLQTALVFHSDKKLKQEDFDTAEKAVTVLENKKSELGITLILTHFNQEELKEQLVSEDEDTILVSVNVSADGREGKEISKALYNALDDVELEHYYTGNWLIADDLVTNSQEGLKKTEGITVVFILVVLLLVFKSAVASIIPLVTVGFSYLAAQSIVAILVDKVNFPLSTFTQIFLVAVLFGIGTDYCILLLSRFKEEMSKNDSVVEAIIITYKNAGKTVFFSGLAVMIGFASIGFSTFVLYQSAAAVAIGVALLLLALFTVVPFFMAVLGKKLFWPSKGKLEHGESKIWGFAGKFALARPLIALLIVAAISVPALFSYDGDLSFNSLEEIGDDFNSIKGFNIISDAFGPGESMPTQIVIKNDGEMNTSEYIALTEKISQELSKISDVDSVRSVTRPTGETIDELYISEQVKSLEDGLGQGNDGIQKISSGLAEAGSQLAANQPKMEEATAGISELITGTNKLQTGMGTIQQNLAKIEDGLKQGAAGSTQVKEGLEVIKTKSAEVLAGSKQLLEGYKQAAGGLSTLAGNYEQITMGVSSLHDTLASTNQYFANLESDYSDIGQNENYQAIKMTIQGSQAATAELAGSLNQLNAGLTDAQQGIDFANGKFSEAIAGQGALVKGMEDLLKGLTEIETGLYTMGNGQGQIVDGLPQVTSGLSGVNNGQQQLLTGFKDMSGQITQLTDGLTQSSDGLNQVSDGLESAQEYLAGVSKQEKNGFYIPQDVLNGKDFEQALDVYMSKDRKVMTIDVVFTKNPYSNDALDRIPEIKESVDRVVKDTKLENAEVAVGGVSSMHHDLDEISQADYSRTVVLMLIGITLILIILFRSIIMPLYLIGSLILTYYTSMALAEVIFVNWLGYTGISWAVPFFAFVILIALGIDYSIFLMDRFNEFKQMPVEQAILEAMKKMGTVIISAAVILGGTFAAMMPAGVLSLLEIAAILLIGLSLYALVILPLFVPVMVKTFGKSNWWPFKKNNDSVIDNHSTHM
ncbi:RND superfamily putative drug exporter [Neobacillus niacini]|uniref:MMPL family transporter n=1 Tax=Neobacillus niacini TaxID=86668 RepID=UPI002862B874|nr:MMPL family transporter [Neobacillus niacini]MDR7077626.1 RND superfamily putative drug exporter [Neobacillus niacini]